jgi:hypothetical protein
MYVERIGTAPCKSAKPSLDRAEGSGETEGIFGLFLTLCGLFRQLPQPEFQVEGAVSPNDA